MSRKDGRQLTEIRGRELRVGEMSAFDGSAWYSHGGTAVLATVSGPIAARIASEDYSKAIVELTVKRVDSIPTAGGASRPVVDQMRTELLQQDAELSGMLANIVRSTVMLHLFPRCSFSIAVNILSDDGSLPSVAANAVMCALLDASIPCRTTFAAVTVASINNALFLDITKLEQEAAAATGTYVMSLPACGGGVMGCMVSSSPGSVPLSFAVEESMERLAVAATSTLLEYFRDSLVNAFEDDQVVPENEGEAVFV